MKKASRIIISILLIAAMIVPAAIFANAEVNVSTTPSKQGGEPYEYYNLKDGLYTKKTVSGPLDNGNYQVELEAYTSDVRYLSNENKQILDIMCLVDTSNSMAYPVGNKERMKQLKTALENVMESLVNNYQAGTKIQINTSIWTFSNRCTDALSHVMGYTALTSDNYTKTIQKKINRLSPHRVAGGTDTEEALTKMNEIIGKRIQDTKGDSIPHAQMLLLFTDGAPSEAFGGFDEQLGEKYANGAIKQADKLKDMGVSIYSVGIGTEFSAIGKQNKNTLNYIINSSGWSKDLRRASLFLNMVSSGWKAQKYCPDCEEKIINNKCENKKCKNYNAEIPKKSQVIKSYGWRSASGDTWENAFEDYTQYTNPKNPTSYYYIGGVNDANNLAPFIANSIMYSMATRVVSNGALLDDFSIKDTISNYFEVVLGTTKIYKVPYLATQNADGSWSNAYTVDAINNRQYGESSRKWAEGNQQIDITSKIEYTELQNEIEVLCPKDSSSVIDVCVIDDMVIQGQEEHKGNKLRITFEIRPKDSFMGGSDVPTNIYKESGIFDKDGKAVQNFANLSATGILDTSSVPKLQVELVNATAHINDDNVKIGYLYNLDDLGKKNLTLTYKGRYSNDEYTVKLKDSEYVVYDATGAEVKYSESKATDENPKSVDTKPDDYAEIIIGENHIDETLNNKGIVTNSKLIQFNSTGITQTDGEYSMQTPKVNKYVYLLWKGMKTSSTYLNERFPEYNKTGKDRKATTLDGIVNGIRYFSGREAIRQLDTRFNVNVYVPTVKVSDAVVNSNKTYPVDSDTLSAAIDNYTIQNADDENTKNLINDQTLSSLVFAQADTSSNSEFVLVDIGDNGLPKAVSSNTSFVNDAFSFNEAVNIKGYLKAFADSDGNAKVSGDAITNKDQLRFAISYVALNDKLNALNKDAPFKLTVDEFWATNECDICKAEEKYVPQYLGYQAQVHKMITTDNITVRKTGCNASHTNGSFVFTVIGMNEKDGKPDLDSMKVLNNFTIQGNGQRTISVNTSAYKYFCVVEDLNALVIKEQEGTKNAELIKSGWTWDYTKNVTVNGTKWESIIKNAFTMDNGDGYSLTFNNEYNPNNSTLHYASAYATNTMSHDKVEVTTSPSNITK